MDYKFGPKKLTFKNYKCFTVESIIPWFSNFNIIIGRNNSGKSSFIDVIHALCNAEFYNSETPSLNVEFTYVLDRDNFNFGVQNGSNIIYSTYTNDYHFINIFNYGLAKKEIAIEIAVDKKYPSFSYHSTQETQAEIAQSTKIFVSTKQGTKYNPYESILFRNISSERDIVPEQLVAYKEKPDINSKGAGATSYICSILNDKFKDDSIVQKNILNALNQILGIDGKYQNIKVKRDEKEFWEIYLETEEGKQYPLSQLGSGLKTILLVLFNLVAIPNANHKYIFAFEELENNLHPALEKRLYSYILNYSREHNYIVFLTTHSATAIDLFSKESDVQFYKTERCEDKSKIIPITNFDDSIETLNDLGIKPSDIMQSNGIIWVEGPSDRIYIKHWLDKLCPGEFEEGRHYQFIYYGGRLLSHYTACNPSDEEVRNYINILAINTNAFLVMDKDGRSKQTKLAKRKEQIITKLEGKGIHYWITAGREIENYLDLSSIGIKLNRFDKLEDKLNKHFDKIEFAKKHCDTVNFNYLKLNESMNDLVSEIRRWNKI